MKPCKTWNKPEGNSARSSTISWVNKILLDAKRYTKSFKITLLYTDCMSIIGGNIRWTTARSNYIYIYILKDLDVTKEILRIITQRRVAENTKFSQEVYIQKVFRGFSYANKVNPCSFGKSLYLSHFRL